jgi:hypothetical protein
MMDGNSQAFQIMNDSKIKLYRGFDEKLGEGIARNPYWQIPRTPKHSNKLVHQLADEWFQNRFGIAARSSTIICSTSIAQAATFAKPEGCLAVIKPIGNYRLVYSTCVKDFLKYASDGVTADRASVWEWLKNQNYQCVASTEQISPFHAGEVLVHCESFNLQHITQKSG